MKKLSSLAALFIAAFVFMGCTQPEYQNVVEYGEVKLNIETLELAMTPFTRASTPTDAGLTKLHIAFFDANNTQVELINQTNETENFGQYSTTLAVGTYTIVVVGSVKDVEPTITPSLVSFSTKVRSDIFYKTASVTITSNATKTVDISLERAITSLVLKVTDDFPENFKKFTFSLTKGNTQSFNPATGFAAEDASANVNIGTDKISDGTCYVNFFLTKASDTINELVITAVDGSNNTLATHTLSNVTFKRNYKTTATGVFFHATTEGTITVNTAWGGDDIVTEW